MLSPYSARTRELFETLNQQFASLLELNTPYKQADVLPQERYGFVNAEFLNPGNKDVRTGYQIYTFNLNLLVSAGCETFPQSVGLGAFLMLELAAAIPLIKRTLEDGSIHDVVLKDEIVAPKRTTLKPPFTWIVDATCTMSAPIAIYKNEHGEHVIDDGTARG
jgi:hypothetical protein